LVTESTELQLAAIDEFIGEGLVREVLSTIKSGKEATAYLCRGTKKLGARYAVAKAYYGREHRNFGNDALYQEGRVVLSRTVRAALAAKSETGRRF
jgi:RIO kinase 1